jgi:hypothetical protein
MRGRVLTSLRYLPPWAVLYLRINPAGDSAVDSPSEVTGTRESRNRQYSAWTLVWRTGLEWRGLRSPVVAPSILWQRASGEVSG